MAQASACDCGYQPRASDCHEVVMDDDTEYSYVILHVVCYSCGNEWVE